MVKETQLKTLETRIKDLEKKLDVVLNLLMAEYYEDEVSDEPVMNVNEIEEDLLKLT